MLFEKLEAGYYYKKLLDNELLFISRVGCSFLYLFISFYYCSINRRVYFETGLKDICEDDSFYDA